MKVSFGIALFENLKKIVLTNILMVTCDLAGFHQFLCQMKQEIYVEQFNIVDSYFLGLVDVIFDHRNE